MQTGIKYVSKINRNETKPLDKGGDPILFFKKYQYNSIHHNNVLVNHYVLNPYDASQLSNELKSLNKN